MNEKEAVMQDEIRRRIVETGKTLLDTGLVARTWGNASERLEGSKIFITPSGLDYRIMREEDIVLLDIENGQWTGNHKPSGERKVHKVAYDIYDEVGFVIHTHQTYATAIGLAGFDGLDITLEERERLGGVALADYGLSGTKKLASAVAKAMECGAQTVLMEHHGALICGKNSRDAIERALLLEEICRRNCMVTQDFTVPENILREGRKIKELLNKGYDNVDILQTPQAVLLSREGIELTAQIDDMAQMIGRKVPVASGLLEAAEETERDVWEAMEKHAAVIIPGVGIAVRADSRDDLEALMLLMQKAAIVKLHTGAFGRAAELGRMESTLMHLIYSRKYSKQKEG